MQIKKPSAKMYKGGMTKKYAMGGMTSKMPNEVPTTMSTPKPMMAMGGMSKKMGYAKGGMVRANCGASMKPTQKGKK
jgi:hypothetical protein